MSKSKGQPGGGTKQTARGGQQRLRVFGLLLTAYCLLLAVGCRMDMQDQPRYEVYESSTFFKDGLAARPLVEGTVARGYLKADKELYTGKIDRSRAGATTSSGQNNQNANLSGTPTQTGGTTNQNGAATTQAGATTAAQGDPNDVETFPFPVTAEVVNRGQERYKIFCAMCHGETGYGDGMIVRRGFRKPPSYHEAAQRTARVGHIFDVITNGWGSMPSYNAQIPVRDRWAIIAYVRALQLSQQGVPAQPAPAPNTGGTK